MYKFYWNNLPRSHGGRSGQSGGEEERGEGAMVSSDQDDCDSRNFATDKKGTFGKGGAAGEGGICDAIGGGRGEDPPPKLPVRCQNSGVTVRVKPSEEEEAESPIRDHKEEAGDPQRQHQHPSSSPPAARKKSAVGGSHKVLLRLRRISSSGAGRPKSISDASEIGDGSEGDGAKRDGAKERRKTTTVTMKSSRSMHHFHQYNKTWNERSLTKFSADYFAGESFHDYENVYSGGDGLQHDDDDYDDDDEHVFGGGNGRPVHVDQVSCNSVASRASRRRQFIMNLVRQGRGGGKEREAGLPPPAPTGTGQLYRSKSCERPKMKEAIKGMQQNINRLSSNLADRVSNRLQQHQQQHQHRRRRKRDQLQHQRQQQQHSQMSQSMSSFALSCSSNGAVVAEPPLPHHPHQEAEGEVKMERVLLPLSIETGENASFCHIMQSQGNLQQASAASPSNRSEDCLSNYSSRESEEKHSLRSFNSTLSRSDAGSTLSGVATSTSPANDSMTMTAAAAGQKIRGIQKKISRLRSRSVERISQRSQMVRERLHQLQMQRQEQQQLQQQQQQPLSLTPLTNSTAQLMVPTAPRSGGHILPTPLPNRHMSIGGDEEEQQPDKADSKSSANSIEQYQGPLQGRARALVDYTPSPYDRDALKFKRGDHIDIISMNPSGLWKGRTKDGRVGNFKFINVEVLRSDQSREGRRRRSRRNSLSSSGRGGHSIAGDDEEEEEEEEPSTVEQLLRRHELQTYLSVFVLNGYEEISNLQDMSDSDLDYLGIRDPQHREKILQLASIIKQEEEEDSLCGDDDDVGGGEDTDVDDSSLLLRRLSFPRDSGCFTSANSSSANSASETSSSAGMTMLAATSSPHVSSPSCAAVARQKHQMSSPSASERSSSSSSSSSQPESGIGLRRTRMRTGNGVGGANNSSEDSDTIVSSTASPSIGGGDCATHVDRQLIQRSAEQAAKTRARAGVNNINNNVRGDAKFEELVQKYAPSKAEKMGSSGFHSARSIFERAAAASDASSLQSSSACSSPKKASVNSVTTSPKK